MSVVDIDRILNDLTNKANPAYLQQLTEKGFDTSRMLGVPMQDIKIIAGFLQMDHIMGWSLWDTTIYEARLLAAMIMDPFELTEEDVDYILQGFDTPDMAEHFCEYLFKLSPHVKDYCVNWTAKRRLYSKLSGYLLMRIVCSSQNEIENSTIKALLLAAQKNVIGETREQVLIAAQQAIYMISRRGKDFFQLVLKSLDELEKSADRGAIWVARNVEKKLKDEGRIT
jgi:3-methyladenine DNA glycosylase AlkD